MSGALGALTGLGTGSGGGSSGSDVTPDAINWTDATGANFGVTNKQTISGINAPISLQVNRTGVALLYYIKNGASAVNVANGGVVVVVDGDTLAWSIGTNGTSVSGVVTVTNQSDGGATVDTFNYDIFEFNYPF